VREGFNEIWGILKKYIVDIWGILLGTWYVLKIDDISKINQIAIFFYLMLLFKIKIEERYGKRTKSNTATSLFRKIVKKNKSVKYLDVGDNAEIQVKFVINLYDKIRKEGPEDMKTIWKYFGKGLTFARANKFTSLGNISILGFYYTLMEDLFKTYGYSVTDQPNRFYTWFILYTLGTLLALIAANGYGWDTIESFFARTNKNRLNKLMDGLIGLSISTNAELVKEKLIHAFELLEKVKPFIREEQYKNIKVSLANINQELKKYNANKVLQQEAEKEELLALAKQMQQSSNDLTPVPPQHNPQPVQTGSIRNRQ
jgi:hypothetical protein